MFNEKYERHSPQRSLWLSVLELAVRDCVRCSEEHEVRMNRINAHYERRISVGDLLFMMRAREYITSDNAGFREVCGLCNITPEFAEKQIWKKIRFIDQHQVLFVRIPTPSQVRDMKKLDRLHTYGMKFLREWNMLKYGRATPVKYMITERDKR